MTRQEAIEIIDHILADRASLITTGHFRDRLIEQDYIISDARKILRERNIEREPERNEERDNYEVRMRGRSSDGRDTRLVLGLKERGNNVYVTITDIKHVGRR